jgi:hypothetical protein
VSTTAVDAGGVACPFDGWVLEQGRCRCPVRVCPELFDESL